MKQVLAVLAVMALPVSSIALPVANQWDSEVDPKLKARVEAATKLVQAEKYAEAIPILRDLVKETPAEADLFNWLGFAYRKTGDFKNSAVAYKRALELEPGHLQALEYQGELFLALGDHDRAEANLRRIETLCSWPCEESKPLAEAIAKWRAQHMQ